ncbi:MAG: serine/threonine protein kinase [Gemmatimonadetes bacterium]|nr:serine/threonine protein kinase [Gemmatimonadota bacterium]
MPSLSDRLAATLSPDYEIRHELDRGGMGIVFLAHDVMLQREVAIKVLRPELATARAADRFLREARVLAALRHPGIIDVHGAGEADGLPYYVMDYIRGTTLADRLESGALEVAAAVSTGLALLDALGVAHQAGVVHRDIKPSNILLLEDRVILGDFGLAKSDADTSSESSRRTAGTPGYMPPEQAAGQAVTPRTDLYAVAMIVFEATTGRRWLPRGDPADADWSGVPRPVMRVLLRALAWAPDERWADAAVFRRELAASHPQSPVRKSRRMATLAAAVTLSLTAVVVGTWLRGDEALADLAVMPLDAVGLPATLGMDIAILTQRYLEAIPQLRLTPDRIVMGVHRRGHAADPMARARLLGARFVASGSVAPGGTGIQVRVTIMDSVGPTETTLLLHGDSANLAAIADSFAVRVITSLYPQLRQTYRGPVHLSDNFLAVREFLHGEAAYYGGAWLAAQRHYEAAIRHDPEFALARWRLINAYRWTPGRTPDLLPALERLRSAGVGQLSPLDLQLVEAQLARGAAERIHLYEQAMLEHPRDEYAVLLFGEELFHRGPLAGVPFDSALAPLIAASELDPFLTPAFELLAWFHIRERNRDASARALARLGEITQPLPSEEVSQVEMLRYAWTEQFDPVAAAPLRAALFDGPDRAAAERLDFAMRAGLAFSLPVAQLELGQLAVAQRQRLDLRWKGHYAQGLALIALGRPLAGFRQLDSAAMALRSDSARMLAAQWRVLPGALGLAIVSSEASQRARADLESLASSPVVASHATWTLAIDALSSGDTVRVRQLVDDIAARGRALLPEHASLLDAYRAARAGNVRMAIDRSAPLLDLDVRHDPGDPFFRSVLHILRGDWLEQLGDASAAETARLYYENTDIVGWLFGMPQAAETEWALAPYLDLRRALSAQADPSSACLLAERALWYWTDVEPGVQPLRDQATSLVERLRRAGAAAPCRR